VFHVNLLVSEICLKAGGPTSERFKDSPEVFDKS
jgi:hypothetical protein